MLLEDHALTTASFFLEIGLFTYSIFFMVIYSFHLGFSIYLHRVEQSNLRILCPTFLLSFLSSYLLSYCHFLIRVVTLSLFSFDNINLFICSIFSPSLRFWIYLSVLFFYF